MGHKNCIAEYYLSFLQFNVMQQFLFSSEFEPNFGATK